LRHVRFTPNNGRWAAHPSHLAIVYGYSALVGLRCRLWAVAPGRNCLSSAPRWGRRRSPLMFRCDSRGWNPRKLDSNIYLIAVQGRDVIMLSPEPRQGLLWLR